MKNYWLKRTKYVMNWTILLALPKRFNVQMHKAVSVRCQRCISLTLNYVPNAWKGTRVTFVPKAGKNGWTSPKHFRSISLTPFVLKTVERLVDRYIRDKILTAKSLRRDQHAYRDGHSTETALSKAANLIEDQLNLKGFAIGTFVGIEGTFIHTSSEVIRRAMIR